MHRQDLHATKSKTASKIGRTKEERKRKDELQTLAAVNARWYPRIGDADGDSLERSRGIEPHNAAPAEIEFVLIL